jgi:hypothetical protein
MSAYAKAHSPLFWACIMAARRRHFYILSHTLSALSPKFYLLIGSLPESRRVSKISLPCSPCWHQYPKRQDIWLSGVFWNTYKNIYNYML